jgi:hypothetical protein
MFALLLLLLLLCLPRTRSRRARTDTIMLVPLDPELAFMAIGPAWNTEN